MLKDSGDKIDSSDKENLNKKVNELRQTISKNNIEDIKNGKEDLQKLMFEVSTKLYQKSAEQQSDNQTENASAGTTAGSGSDEKVYDADFKDVDNNKN